MSSPEAAIIEHDHSSSIYSHTDQFGKFPTSEGEIDNFFGSLSIVVDDELQRVKFSVEKQFSIKIDAARWREMFALCFTSKSDKKA